MWPDTNITRLLNITLPLIQAPMAGGATTPELIAAVSNAGGLGSLGAGYMTPDDMWTAIRQIKKLTSKPFAVNLFVTEKHQASSAQIDRAKKAVEQSCKELNYTLEPIAPPFAQSFDEQMHVVLTEKVPVFSFVFGLPAKSWLVQCKEAGVTLIGTATTLEEARMLSAFEVDVIVAQGSEAGGHRGTFLGQAEDALIGLGSLLPQLVDHIKRPIIAAGGIMDGRGIVAALTLGASGVQMGTAFLTCKESGIHPNYKDILLASLQDNTTLTRAFSGKLARGIKNTFIARMQDYLDDILDYPIQNALTIGMRKEAMKQGSTDFMSMWAGQTAYLCKDLPAAEVMHVLNDEVTKLLKKQT